MQAACEKNATRKVVIKVGLISIWGLHTKSKRADALFCGVHSVYVYVCVSEFSWDIIDG